MRKQRVIRLPVDAASLRGGCCAGSGTSRTSYSPKFESSLFCSSQITLLTFGWLGAVQKFFTSDPLRTVPVGDDESHRVDPRYKGKLMETSREGVTTLYDLAADAFSRYAERNCMGSRKFLGWKNPKVKLFGTSCVAARCSGHVE